MRPVRACSMRARCTRELAGSASPRCLHAANTDGMVRLLLRAMPALDLFCAVDACITHRETFEQCAARRSLSRCRVVAPIPAGRRCRAGLGSGGPTVCRLPRTLRVCRLVADEPGCPSAPLQGSVAASIVHTFCSMHMLRDVQLFHVALCADLLLTLLCDCTDLRSAMLDGSFDRSPPIKPRGASKSKLQRLVVRRPIMPFLELVLDVAPELAIITIIDGSQHIMRALERLVSERGRAIMLQLTCE
jgi:hypothetical protein